MTVSNSNRTAGPFVGNGSATSFPFTFKVFSAADIVVMQSNGITQTQLVANSDYTIQLSFDQEASAGGAVVLKSPLAVGSTLVITSDIPDVQPTSITNQGGFYPKVIEQALDRLTILIQQVRSTARRSLRFPLSDTGVNTELPPKSVRANNLLSFDSNGNPVAIAPSAQTSTALQFLLSGSTGAALIGFLQAGAGAVLRTLQAKAGDTVSVKDFGAKGDGVTDDSKAFADAFAAGRTVTVPFGVYFVKNIVIGTHQTLNGNGALFKAAPGANWIFKLTGFRAVIRDAYFEDSAGNIPDTFMTNAAVIVEDAAYPEVHDSRFVNLTCGIILRTTANDTAHQVTNGSFSNLRFDTIKKRGIYMAQNVNTCTFTNIRMYVGTLVSNGKEIPRAGCIGFQIFSTDAANTSGGHMLTNVDIEQAETGFQFTSAGLCWLTTCFADSLSGVGYQFTGACSDMKLINCLAGTCLVGYEIAGTSTKIYIDSVDTVFNGHIPPWGDPANFFKPGEYYDIAVLNTAKVVIGSWLGEHKIYVDSTASLNFEGGEFLYSGTANPVAPGTTLYFGPVGANTADVVQWVAPRDGVLYGLRAQCASAPGNGQSFTYTARVNGSNTVLAASVNGNSSFEGRSAQLVNFAAGQVISISLVTSAGAAPTTHRLALSIKYF